ncbi:sensor histidine kinase [Thiomicrorhabdus sp. 6S2-11]|uniref:histidine kinase n=1 Tax=Thiomicrorhabdus marina TaxID=2818442 RepID=A0ABS3Q4Q8_9GAMM|nr:sensor histidine kinase [Thiomicrorhabdus marina]MBO1927313.1 sensor histidine kinase [Thiomicrorhabdus marina]
MLFRSSATGSTSIQKQLFVTLTFSLVTIFGVFWWLSQTALHTISESYVLTRLEHDKNLVADHLVRSGDLWMMDHSSIGPIYMTPQSGHYYVIQTPKDTLYSPSLNGFRMLEKASDNIVDIYETKGPMGDVLLVRSESMLLDGQKLRIYIAENHSPIQQMVLRYDLLFALFTLFALLSLYFLHRWLLRRAFNRLNPLEQQLQAFQLGQSLELDKASYPQEVHSLLNSLQLALEKSRLQFEQSRQHNSNLSHSLKTPLNLIFQLIEDQNLQQYPQLREQLKQQSQLILALIERELKAERFAQNQVIAPLPLQDLVTDLQNSFSQLYQQKNIQLHCDFAQDAQLLMEQEDAFELFGNLLDNAYKWAHGNVYCKIDEHGLSIEDDGPGVSDDKLHRLEMRGFRTDETKPGHGIGLSIVKQLAEAYKAKLHFSHSSFGGLKVQVCFKEAQNKFKWLQTPR